MRTHASDYRLVHILWDPVHACSAQWALTQTAANLSLASVCQSMHMEEAIPMFKRAKRDRLRVLQPRLEDLVSRKPSVGPPAWRHLFKFLELQERAGDLTAIATRAIAELELRSKVLNKATQGRATALIATNETLYEDLRRLRREVEYTGAGKPGVGSLLTGRQLDVA